MTRQASTEKKAKLVLRREFRKLMGRTAWDVRGNYGTWLRFAFGEPTTIQGRMTRGTLSERWAKKFIVSKVRGEVTIFVQNADWEMRLRGTRIAHSESPRKRIVRTALLLEGSRPTGVAVHPDSRRIELIFDNELSLTLRPFPRGWSKWWREDVLLHLYDERGRRNHLEIRRDFRMSCQPIKLNRSVWVDCPVSELKLE